MSRPVNALRGRTIVFGILWLVSLALWLPAGLAMMGTDSSGGDALTAIFVAALALPLVSTLTWGVHLGRDSRWRMAAVSIPVGFCVLMFAYTLAFILGPDANADLEAGAGIGLLSVPTLLGLAILISAGAGMGAAWRHIGARQPR